MKPPIELPSDLREVIHPFRLSTIAYLVWASPRAQRLCQEERRRIPPHQRRIEVGRMPYKFPEIRPASWIVAMPIGEPDEAIPAVQWASSLPRSDRGRLALFPLPSIDIQPVERRAAALEVPLHVFPVPPRFENFHRALGIFWNLWLYLDLKAGRVEV